MEYGLQLYSVRDITEKNLALALEKVAQIGYKYVEFAGFFGHSAAEINAMLSANGLKISGTHSGLNELVEDFAGTVAYHHAIGNTNFIVPWAPWETAEELSRTVEQFNSFKPLLDAEGIRLAYHNHDGEFLPNKDGLVTVEELWNRTEIDFEVDTYWAFAAGKDPVRVLEEMKARVPVIHLKDGDRSKNGHPLGDGEAPVVEVRKKAMELGMLMVVESEDLQPDGISEVSRCFEFLKTL